MRKLQSTAVAVAALAAAGLGVVGATANAATAAPAHNTQAARTARSAQSIRGRGWVRRSTAISCRSTSSSASLEADDRPSRTSQPHSRTKMR